MSYPQTDPNLYAANGSQFWRLKTTLDSPGDIYESEQSFLALSIGSQSDIARVKVTYRDPYNGNASQASNLIVSPERTFVGLIGASNETYPQAKKRGRVLFSLEDIYDPSWTPAAFAAGDTMAFQTPVLDVVGYFSTPPSLVPQRADKTYQFTYFNPAPGKVQYVAIPYYGRKYAFVDFTNWIGGTPVNFGIIGVNFSTRDNPAVQANETAIRAPAAVAGSGGHATKVVRATVDGLFDMLVLSVDAAGPCTTRVFMTDAPL